MNLYVLGSSSSGNCYLLYNERSILIIEAGVPFKELNKLHLFDLKKVAGCIITHEHGDHASRVKEYQEKGIKCYASSGTISKLNENVKNISLFNSEDFEVFHFPVDHDASDPVGFYIKSGEETILFATDTYVLRYNFKELTSILIECNYSMDILNENLKNGKLSASRRDRTILSHMELNVCLDTIKSNDIKNVNKIVLLHLSDLNSDEELFVRTMEENLKIKTYAAKKDLNIDLDTPF